MQTEKKISILGTRGIPANHGGFETCVEKLAPYLSQKGWEVTVYCQHFGKLKIWKSDYRGVNLVNVAVPTLGVKSTIIFDLITMYHALRREGLLLSFGYPTGAFALFPRILGRYHIINMDGIEWKRTQFSFLGKVAYYINERLACWFGNILIADHPEIEKHLATRVNQNKVVMIPYGSDPINIADESILRHLDLEIDNFAVVIARPEPDNSILEIVRTFSKLKIDKKLVVLGKLDETKNYHKAILNSANDKVIFIGAIYDQQILHALRKYARFYVHGHRVGGTNPSLVESLGAGSANLAHSNKFNKWVAGASALYFIDDADMSSKMLELFYNQELVVRLRSEAIEQHNLYFGWKNVLESYASVLMCDGDR